MRFVVVAMIAVGVGACSNSPESCTVLCTNDSDCPDGQACGELGRCTSGVLCPCEAGEFLGCDGESARFCAANADAIDVQACGPPGCNENAQRCNECVPDQGTCDGNMLTTCGADGLAASTVTCTQGCLQTPDHGLTPTHCLHIAPVYLSDVCETRATMPDYVITAATALDTSVAANCTAVVTQSAGPEICVLRYRTITINQTLTVTGTRALALVADDSLTLAATGTIIAKAVGPTSGPGGGTTLSGVASGIQFGGGGAGFRHAGGNGGAAASSGGPTLAPSPTTSGFIGGPRPNGPVNPGSPGSPGGGGGAIMLAACEGTVSVAGAIHAGGGGGGPGGGNGNLANIKFFGGHGGGTGGYVVMQGYQVVITGRVYANGGGGGSGCQIDYECVGLPGDDGQPSASPANGGNSVGDGGRGGFGGNDNAPSDGELGATPYLSPGGGGGAAGRIQVYRPSGVTPTITPAGASPTVETPMIVPTR